VARGENAPRVVDVLEREGNAVERAAVLARSDLRLRLPRLLPGQVEGGRDEHPRLRVELLHSMDERVHQLYGGKLARGDQTGQLGYGEVVEVCGHVGMIPGGRILRQAHCSKRAGLA
jgi:hypothetical protein